MGGSHSNTVNSVTDVLNESIQSSTQDCVKIAKAENTAVVDGDHNYAQDIKQSAVAMINGKCVMNVTQDSKFSNDISEKIEQKLKDEGVALTQWLDTTKTSNSTNMKTNISTIISNSSSQKCINNADGVNVALIRGSGNVLDRVDQTSRASVVSNCLMGNEQSAAATNDIAKSATQSSVTVSKNPMDFIGDAINALAKAGMVGIAGIFIIIICFIFLTKVMHRHKSHTAGVYSNIGSKGSEAVASA